ncbi:MAG: EAL domain-containing protein [Actinomycetota bacterium]|nr:EAL domain-containing protein [Actinomycetota bacterium]
MRQRWRRGRPEGATPRRRPRTARWPIALAIATPVAIACLAAIGATAYWRASTISLTETKVAATARFGAHQAAERIASAVATLRHELAAIAATPGIARAFTSSSPPSSCHLAPLELPPFATGALAILRPNHTLACASPGAQALDAAASLIRPDPAGVRLEAPAGRSSLELVASAPIRGGGAVVAALGLGGLGRGLATRYGGVSHLDFLVTNAARTTALSRSIDPAHFVGVRLGDASPARSTGLVRRDLGGSLRLFAQATVPGLSWHVFAGALRSTALADANAEFDRALGIILGGLLLVLVGAAIAGRQVVRPLRRLAAAVNGGKLDSQVAAQIGSGPREVLSLAEAFGSLVVDVETELAHRRAAEAAARGAEAAARGAERSYRLLFEDNPQPMWVFAEDRFAILAVNDAAVAYLGRPRDELLESDLRQLLHEDDVALLEASVRTDLTLDRLGPWRLRRADQHFSDAEITSHSLRFGEVPARFMMAEDVTQREAYEAQLRDLALYDRLTGLVNRTVVLDRLARAGAAETDEHHPLAVAIVDLDRFRDVNATHGRAGGDELLRQTANRLASLGTRNITVGRMSADEFVLLCEHLSGEGEALAIADRIESVLEAPFVLGGEPLQMQASIGIALARGARRAEEVLRDASVAMRSAKERGGGRYEVFNPADRAAVLARIETERALRNAGMRGEFRLYYQPEVDLATGRCAAAEALVRWQHPTRGLLAPTEFIAIAEQAGTISSLGRFALKEACQQVARWRADGMGPPTVSVNLSARQLGDDDLVGQITEALDQADVPAEALIVELTESALMQDVDATIATLEALRELGVRVSIDDFGTGYSSLVYLRRLPVTSLKIDRTFVAEVERDVHDAAIVSAVIELGHAFGLSVVAEGVERASQHAALVAMGCDLGQGYLWSPPVPAGDFPGPSRFAHHASARAEALTPGRRRRPGAQM